MEEVSNGGMLYHEVQESKLCVVHCVNTVLQGPFFSEFDLVAVASDLDHTERQMMGVPVLQKVLEVWDLQIIPLDSPVAELAQIDPELRNAFICHLQNHWFCIRKVNGEWYNFESLKPAPDHLSKFYLSAYLDSLKGFGWSIFLVSGKFPKECPISSSEASSGYGQWLLPEDAERITKSCNAAQRTGSRSGQTQWQSVPYRQYEEQGMLLDEEDEDLKVAIAASLLDAAPAVSTKPDTLENENKDNSAANA
ncbi:ataxin-3 homolog [Solanum lycopersicum]|uniref:ataxin-3 homolog n=1 Tax=Solanum lycopersicum TaxID=4081 RepID=UPI0008FEBBC6|nr:ataxin-3 homolog [Solanum lycopersicum]